jgi:hypothetical protein
MQNFCAEAKKLRTIAQRQIADRTQPGRYIDIGTNGRRTRREPDNAVGQEYRLLNVMRHEDHCLRILHLNAPHFYLQLLAQLRVQRAERLVHEQYLRARGQRARNGHALAHAAGNPRWIALAERF